MTFTDRKAQAEGMVLDFLSGYTPPRGLDESQLSQRVSFIADAFARRMPAGDSYMQKIEGVFSRVRDNHESNTWPAQAVFVAQMPAGEVRKGAPSSYSSDDSDRIPKLMAAGAPVPEYMIWQDVRANHEVLDRYRGASVDNWRATYRGEAHDMMVKRYGAMVGRYFD